MPQKEEWIAIYSRKSKFTGRGESIENQVELCKEYVRTHYGETALNRIQIYEDEGFSGGNLNRPAFRKMMQAARNHAFQVLIVYRLDRISRNISDFAGLIEELSRLNTAFVSIREQFDTESPLGRAMMYIASVFSQLERETIAERIRDNLHELAKTGRWLGGTTPTGYRSVAVRQVTVDGKIRQACQLKQVPGEAQIVKTIFALYVATDSQAATEAELIRRGIQTKNGRHFSRFSIRSILQNPVYAIADSDTYDYFVKVNAELFSGREAFDGTHGMMAYNRTRQQKGKTTEFLPPEDWIVSVGKHPGIIPGRIWVQVQESLARNKSKSYHKPRSNEALLTGLLYCSCGSRMYPKLSSRKTAEGKPIYTYFCKMKERSRHAACGGKNINGNRLDLAVLEQIQRLAEDQRTFRQQLEQSRKFYAGGRADSENRLNAMRREKEELAKKIAGLVDSLAELKEEFARNQVEKRIAQLSQEEQERDWQIQEWKDLSSRQMLQEAEFDGMRQLLSVFPTSMDGITVEEKRAAIRTIVRKVIWDGAGAHIFLFGVTDEEIGCQASENGMAAPGNVEGKGEDA